ncbi:MAG: hypothetical protein AAF612_00700 [Planctomycetota bacterium]
MTPNHPRFSNPQDPQLDPVVAGALDAFQAQAIPGRPDDPQVAAALHQQLADAAPTNNHHNNHHNNHANHKRVGATHDEHDPTPEPETMEPETGAEDARELPSPFLAKRFVMRVVTPLAAAAAVAVAFLVFFNPVVPATPAFAQVAQRLQQVQTVTWKMSVEADQGVFEGAGEAANPGFLRQDINLPGGHVINIIDFTQDRMITLVPAQNLALEASLGGLPESQRPQNFLDEFKNIDEQHATFAGEEAYQGRAVLRYDILRGDTTGRVLVDPDTQLPVLIEMSTPTAEPTSPTTVTMYDFAWDAPLDMARFDLGVPEGYTSPIEMNFDNPTGQDIVEALLLWTTMTDGEFPDEFNTWTLGSEFEALMKGGKLGDATPEERDRILQQRVADYLNLDVELVREINEDEDKTRAMEMLAEPIGNTLGRAGTFLGIVQNAGEFAYTGAGAKLGEEDRVICWFKLPEDEQYTVVFGDLRTELAPEPPEAPVPPTAPEPPAVTPEAPRDMPSEPTLPTGPAALPAE